MLFIIFIHIVASAIILGGEVFLQFIVYPCLTKTSLLLNKDSDIVKLYDRAIPIVFGSSMAVGATGILLLFNMYSYFKDADNNTLLPLAIKLLLILTVILISSYQTFSLRPKMRGIYTFQKDVTPVATLLKHSRFLSLITITAVLIAFLSGIYLGRG